MVEGVATSTPEMAPVPVSATGTGSPQAVGGVFLQVSGLVKQFPGTLALDHVDLTVRRGEIHALLGENGAGKSTLIRQVCGASQPTSGKILIEGAEVVLPSPHAAASLGIAVVHQHFNLVPQISVVENLFLTEGLPRRAGIFVNWATSFRRALAAEGHAFLYVSHKLAEVFEIADRVTVLRDGRNAGHWTREQLSRRAIIEAIVGSQKALIEDTMDAPVKTGAVLLSATGARGGRVVDMSFELRAHEILGIAGLPGGGAEEALDLLYGRYPMSAGRLAVGGKDVVLRSPRDAKAAGLALVPKDRHAESLLPGASVRENISLPNLDQFITDRLLRLIRRGRERTEAESIGRRLAVKMAGVEAPIQSLSGGNQQKAILGRWLASGAKIFLLNSPTAAVDIGAKAEIYALIREIAANGAGVIFTSTEVEEFPRVCHRVLVFRDGRIAGELLGKEASEANILNLAAGEGE